MLQASRAKDVVTLLWTLWLGFFLWAVHRTFAKDRASDVMAMAVANAVSCNHQTRAQDSSNLAHALLLRRRLVIIMLARTASARREHVLITHPPETPIAGKPVALQLTGAAPPGPLPSPSASTSTPFTDSSRDPGPMGHPWPQCCSATRATTTYSHVHTTNR